MIETEGLSKRFGGTLAVSELSLRVAAGEVMGFLGPNGSGKTTTIRLLMGLLRPSAGRAAILGRDCHTDAVALKRDVGYLPDEPFLYPYLSGVETLELVAGLHGFAPAEARRRAAAIAERLGLGDAMRALHRHVLAGHEEATCAGAGADPRAARADPRRADQRAGSGGGAPDARDDRGAGGRAGAQSSCRRTCWTRPSASATASPSSSAASCRRWERPTSCAPATRRPATTLEDLFLRVTTEG